MHRAALVLLPCTIQQLPVFLFKTLANQDRGGEAETSDDTDESRGTLTYTIIERVVLPIDDNAKNNESDEPTKDPFLPAEVPECCVCDAEPGTLVLLQQRIGVKCLNARNYYPKKPLEKRAHKKKCPHKDFDSSQLPTDPELRRTTLREIAATGCGFCRVIVIQQLQVSFAIY